MTAELRRSRRANEIFPILGFVAALASLAMPLNAWLVAFILMGAVVAAVHHAEVIAHRVGEPFGTLILALAVTVIEVGLILTLMQAEPEKAQTLARDTVFAAVMVIVNLLLGLCLLLGAIRHHEQSFQRTGMGAALATLTVLTVVTLVLPNFTSSAPGSYYTPVQLGFVAAVSLILYGTFALVQTAPSSRLFSARCRRRCRWRRCAGRARRTSDHSAHRHFGRAAACQPCRGGAARQKFVAGYGGAARRMGCPACGAWRVDRALILAPEGLAAVRAAKADRLQTSLNLALGSALATIGLTIPAVAVLSIITDMPISLGLDAKSTVLLFLSLIVASQTLANGRTTVLQGVIHLMLFAIYLFTTFVP